LLGLGNVVGDDVPAASDAIAPAGSDNRAAEGAVGDRSLQPATKLATKVVTRVA
jgi:hypothetical protein